MLSNFLRRAADAAVAMAPAARKPQQPLTGSRLFIVVEHVFRRRYLTQRASWPVSVSLWFRAIAGWH